jgi:quercetin dioxygenase-like cupin family protein
MMIDFERIEETAVMNFRGGEKETRIRMFADDKVKALYGKLEPGASIGPHTHDTSSELIYILEGAGKVLFDGAYEDVGAGLCHYCPKGHSHSLMNDGSGDMVFFAVVPEQ